MRHKKTQKIVYLALLSALAIVLHTVDHYISGPLPLGVKLGVANIISLIVIDIYGVKEMFIVNIFRVVISGLLTGSIMSYPFFMSCGGVFLSSIVLALMTKFTKLPVVSISIISALFHNIGQLIVVSFVISSAAMMPYVFVMMAAGIPTGIFNGVVAIEVEKRLNKERFS
ncbi:MAG: Gx transporter family protein [Coprobacillus sp.]